MERHPQNGFTLIELLIFSAIFSLIIGSFITILVVMVSVQSSQSASAEVAQQGQFLVQQIQYYVEGARLVDMPQDASEGTLVLRESVASSSFDPTTLTLSSGTVYLQQGTAGALQPLTSGKVTVSNLSFVRHYNLNSSSSAFGDDSVSYSFTMSTGMGVQSEYSNTFQSSVDVSAPVGKIVLLQQAKAENSTGSSVPSLSASYPTSNESGDLLVAVVAYRGVGAASVADTKGNSWAELESASFPSPSGTVALYAALNAQSGANTVTATFSPSATYASVFIYEYRGAATSSSFDASGTQVQYDAATPTSPFVTPTSSPELLIGIDAYNENGATLSPGAGYTLETSSTAGNATQVFLEDQDEYITDPVSAGWTASAATTSTAMVATFK